ncbi:MAG: flippase [bacterium]
MFSSARVLTVSLKNRPGIQKAIANMGWLFVNEFLRMGVGLFVGVWVARYLGPQQFGMLNYAVAFAGLFSVLVSLGLDGIVVRELVNHPEKGNEILGSTFILQFLGSNTAFIAMIAISGLMHANEILLRWLVGIIGFGLIFQSSRAIHLWFQSQVQSKYTVIAEITSFFIVSLTRVVLILKKASLIPFALVYLLQGLLTTAGELLFYYKNGKDVLLWHPTVRCSRQLIRESWPLIISGFAIMIYMKTDQIMLLEMAGEKAAGIYSAAVRLSEVWYFIPMLIASSVFPSLVRSKKIGNETYKRRMQAYFDLSALLAYGLAVPFSLCAPLILNMLYGSAYQGADRIFAIHIWAGLFVFLGVSRSQYLLNEGLLVFSFASTATGAVVNILLNYFLIPKYAGAGAAIATVAAQGISAYMSSFFYRPALCCGYMQTLALFSPIRYALSKGRSLECSR